jgi:hypothetical protein
MVAKVATTSNCREKTKEPTLSKKPKETPLSFMPLYPPLPPAPGSAPSPLTLDGEVQKTVTPGKSGSAVSGASTPLTSLSPMDPVLTPSPPVLTPHPQLNWEYPTVSTRIPPLYSDSHHPADAPEGGPRPTVL